MKTIGIIVAAIFIVGAGFIFVIGLINAASEPERDKTDEDF